MEKITTEIVNNFLNGHDPMEHIISIECDYNDDKVNIIFINKNGEKRIRQDDFKPFIWVKHSAAIRLYEGDKTKLRQAMRKYGISIKKLITSNDNDETTNERLENGYKYLFYATRKMSNSVFQSFFAKGGVPISERKTKAQPNPQQTKEFITVTPVEQYMIQTGRRLFKGYDNYDQLHRFIFDLETQGLNPKVHRIEQIGIHTNRGYDKIISIEGNSKEELDKNELNGIEEFIRILAELKPDTVVGHNSENFDWNFMIVRCEQLGANFSELSLKYFKHPIYKKQKESVLKLGGEIEYYFPTIMWGHNVLDSLHAARRAQAIDSSMKSSNLKYITRYLNLKKPNRVYVPGDKITSTWAIQDKVFGFNNNDGDWYKVTDKRPLLPNYELVSGRYIVERYLLDDLWETDKVEDRLNESNFLVGKMLPTTFTRACTMGTAGIWKLIMLAWSFENNLAIPALGVNKRFVGGLSRLLVTGFIGEQAKLDFNSLYPSIILTWNIPNEVDPSGVLNQMLNYVLGQREKYKQLKGEASANVEKLNERLKTVTDKKEKEEIKREITYWKSEKSANDKKQLPLKILGNSYFGSAGSPAIFPWGNLVAAEKTTCIGRAMLRLLISHFKSLKYEPIVGDSFSGDTPLFIKYDDTNLIDIKPIEELIGKTEVDALGREYDTSEKPYKVLCRSGWVNPSYIYRHKTDKPLYEVSDGNMKVTVTEDHSLFNESKEKIKPSEINDGTKLEYYTEKIRTSGRYVRPSQMKPIIISANLLKNGELDRVPVPILNGSKSVMQAFIKELGDWDYSSTSKTCQAGIQFLKNQLKIV